MGNTELIQASDSNRVWYAYTLEKGGKKMRITGKIRQMLKCHIQFRHYGTYLETSQASHIRGQNLHQVIDQSLLRKIWKPPMSFSRITHMVRMLKTLAGILSTETALTYPQESRHWNKWQRYSSMQTMWDSRWDKSAHVVWMYWKYRTGYGAEELDP